MTLKDIFYNKYYLPTVINRLRGKRRIKNKDFSLFCGNCLGGYVYHQLGLQFKSPTINLMILQTEFLKLMENWENYRNEEFTVVTDEPGKIPVAKLGDVTIRFTHYDTCADAVKKWNERKERVNEDNIFIIMTDRDGITPEDIAALGDINCRKLMIFTAKKYDYPWCFQLKEFENDKQVGNILKKTLIGKWYFEKYFDYVGWFNSDDKVAEHFRIR